MTLRNLTLEVLTTHSHVTTTPYNKLGGFYTTLDGLRLLQTSQVDTIKMDEIKLSDDVFEQIKDFKHRNLTKEQESLIDKLITDEEIKERYKKNGLCNKCKQPNTGHTGYFGSYCQPCNSKRFQQNFKNWTSGNHD
ncbi:hypothetical protein RhiirA1_463682, partial [Rhizophagus irregularis]